MRLLVREQPTGAPGSLSAEVFAARTGARKGLPTLGPMKIRAFWIIARLGDDEKVGLLRRLGGVDTETEAAAGRGLVKATIDVDAQVGDPSSPRVTCFDSDRQRT